MQFNVEYQPQPPQSDCLIVGIYENNQLTPAAKHIDQQSGGYITQILSQGDLKNDIGSTLLLLSVPKISAYRLLLVQCGNPAVLNSQLYRKIISKMACALLQSNTRHADCYLSELPVPSRDTFWKIRLAIEVCGSSIYQYDQTKSQKNPPLALQKLTFQIADNNELPTARAGLHYGEALISGMNWTRDLGNLPANICTPTYLAEQAKQLAQQHSTIKVTILEEKEMQKLGMGALLSVTQGSRQAAKLIVVEYAGADNAAEHPIALVGKGVTFDTGGISLKPSANMDEMKYDMCGGASVLGTIKAAAQLQLPLNIVGIVPATENLPDGLATKPGDVVTSLSGQTVEILNTDAEGRLILCDALTYAERFKPEVVIDIATLTGSVILTFGHVVCGLLSNNEALCEELITAGEQSTDRVWPLPLWDDYAEMINSNFADMANIAPHNDAKCIIAASFLARFTKNFIWAHLDVAGTAFIGGSKEKGATGRPVPLLLQFLWERCRNSHFMPI